MQPRMPAVTICEEHQMYTSKVNSCATSNHGIICNAGHLFTCPHYHFRIKILPTLRQRCLQIGITADLSCVIQDELLGSFHSFPTLYHIPWATYGRL